MNVNNHEWIKQAYIKSDKTGSIVDILKMEFQEVVPKGENFGSDIYRVIMEVRRISGEIDKISVIYKIMPETLEHKMPGINNLETFNTEAMMYIDMLPKLEMLQKQYLPEAQPDWPRLYASKPKHEGFIMEDISVPGYVMSGKWNGLSLDQMDLVLKSLARFHALAAVKIARGGLDHENLNDTYFFFSDEVMTNNVYGRTIFNLIKVIEEHWKGEWLEYVPGLTKLSETILSRIRDSFKSGGAKFCTINHGDLWTNNILFKYDEQGKPESLKIIDWQQSYRNHPGYDLQYIFSTSLRGELFTMRPQLLLTYHEALVKELKQFEYPRDLPSFETIEECYQRARLFGFLIVYSFRPVLMSKNYIEFQQKYGGRKDRSHQYVTMAYGSEEVISSAKIILKEARNDGLF